MKPVIAILSNYIEGNGSAVFEHIGAAGQDWMVLAADYIRAVEQAGGMPIILPIIEDISSMMSLIKKVDGVIFSGGSDIDPFYYGELPIQKLGSVMPIRDQFEEALFLQLYESSEIPILGICRGLQAINVFLGGTLYQDLPTQAEDVLPHASSSFPRYFPSHPVEIEEDTQLSDAFEDRTIFVNSLHHQAIRDLAPGLRINMTAPDGMIEGIESTRRKNLYAVQWHPEMMAPGDENSCRLFRYFIEQAKTYRRALDTNDEG